ncbi:hypothetical protein BC828DRAFT_410108, partial [Blastocladiella britannica]
PPSEEDQAKAAVLWAHAPDSYTNEQKVAAVADCIYYQWLEIERLKRTVTVLRAELRDAEDGRLSANASLHQMEAMWTRNKAPDSLSDVSKLPLAAVTPFNGTGNPKPLLDVFAEVLSLEPPRRRAYILAFLGTKLTGSAPLTYERLCKKLVVKDDVDAVLASLRDHYKAPPEREMAWRELRTATKDHDLGALQHLADSCSWCNQVLEMYLSRYLTYMDQAAALCRDGSHNMHERKVSFS